VALTTSDLAALSRLLDQALELAPSEHGAWLAALPEADRHLADTLRELLAEYAATGRSDLLSTLPKLGDAPIDQPHTGETIGPYRLLREIGQGGMGSVWLAERADGSLKRQIALKLPRLAWGSGLAERMARERDIAALLEHPNIARLYDAGVDQLGRPYLALEYIDGRPIDRWCTEERLAVASRLRLFIQVARAVAYAHGRLVVHRDLKPSNVMVSTDGHAHLLDFGIAKLLDEAGDERLTQQQGRVLTPHYASPEQIRGEAVTVASDIYSLGVLLYQLLTEQLPYKGKTLGKLEQAILEDEPPLASTRVQDKALARQLRGDLDAILTKALKRAAAERYASAEALAEDLQRHLDGKPVLARPDSYGYRLRKGVRRHWIGVGASAAVLVAILSGAGVAVVQAQRASRAAERERAVRDFAAEVFRVNAQGASAAEMRTLPADVFLERSARLVQTRFGGQPAIQADMYGVVGTIFADMGASRLAAEYATRRLEALSAAGAEPAEQARAFIDLATQLLQQGRLDDAEQRAKHAIDLAGNDAALQIDARLVVARVLVARHDYDSAKRVLDEIEARVTRRRGEPTIASAWTEALRARLLIGANRRDESLPLYDAAIGTALAVEGPQSQAATEIRLDVAESLAMTDFASQAQRYFDAAIVALRTRGGDHGIRAAFETARFATARYAASLQTGVREALQALAEARAEMAAGGRVVPEEMRARLDMWEAEIRLTWGDAETALELADRSMPLLSKVDQDVNDRVYDAVSYGYLLMEAGRHELADRWLREALRLQVEMRGGSHPWTALFYVYVARNLARQARFAEALDLLARVPRFEPIRGEGSANPDRYNLAVQLAMSRVLLDSGGARQALAQFPHEMISASGSSAGITEKVDDADALELLGEALCTLGQRAEGMRALRAALALDAALGSYKYAPGTARLRSVAGYCALLHGDRRDAVAWARQARAAFAAQPGVSPYFKAPLLKLEAALGTPRQAN
jgi:eukaryotic-like serine/threonine-protein kinase